MNDQIDLNLEMVEAAADRTVRLQPYLQVRQHDWVRLVVTVGLLLIFAAVLAVASTRSGKSSTEWAQTKEMLQIALPAVTGLLGSVIGFYFGSGSTASGSIKKTQ